MPRGTGFPSRDAQDDFLRGRRRRVLAQLRRVLRLERGALDDVLFFDDVVDALGRVSERDLGIKPIPIASIVGTVDRRTDFDRGFRPRSSRTRMRFERIAEAARRGVALPPIDVYRIGDLYFVRDGHHRVAVARAQGRDTIDARVVDVATRGRRRLGREASRLRRERCRAAPLRAGRQRCTMPSRRIARRMIVVAMCTPAFARCMPSVSRTTTRLPPYVISSRY